MNRLRLSANGGEKPAQALEVIPAPSGIAPTASVGEAALTPDFRKRIDGHVAK
jgi:hypothetical protein